MVFARQTYEAYMNVENKLRLKEKGASQFSFNRHGETNLRSTIISQASRSEL